MAKEKILLVAMSLGLGGAETHIVELAKSLKSKDLDVYACSNGGVYANELVQSGIPHFQAPLHRRSLITIIESFFRLNSVIRRVRPDVIHAHARIPALLCRWLCLIYRIPLVTTVHFNFKINGVLRMLTHWGQKTITVSEDLKKYIIDNYNIDEKQIIVSVNGINTERFSPDSDSGNLLREFDLPPDGQFVVTVSRLDKNACRAAELLVAGAREPCSKNPLLHVIIVGTGNMFDEIKKHADAVNSSLERRAIIMAGGRTDISHFTALADIFVGVSRSALEAMACEKPTILAGNQGWLGLYTRDKLPDCIATNFTCRGHPYPSEGVVWDTITELLDTPPENLAQIKSDSRRAVIEHYSIDRMADDAITACRSLINKRTPKSYDFAVTGYYGHSNIGDEAMLRAVVTNLSKACPNASICVLTASPSQTFGDCKVTVAKRFNVIDIVRVLWKTKVFVFGGGNLIQDVTSTKSLMYYLSLLRLAHLMGKKTMLYANGIGPVQHPVNITRTARVLNRCNIITLRDAKSLEVLKDMGVTAPKAVFTADVTLTIPLPEAARAKEALDCLGLSDVDYILVSVREFKNTPKNFLASFAEAVNEVAAAKNLSVVVLPMHEGVDADESRAFARMLRCRAMVIEQRLSLDEVMSVLCGARIVSAMRLHALVFSACCGTPFAGVSYDPKVDAFMQHFPHLPCQTINNFDKASFARSMTGLIDDRKAHSARIRQITEEWREKAKINALLAKELLEGKL